MTGESYLPPHLHARLEQTVPELRYLARQLAEFYLELRRAGVPRDVAAMAVCALIGDFEPVE